MTSENTTSNSTSNSQPLEHPRGVREKQFAHPDLPQPLTLLDYVLVDDKLVGSTIKKMSSMRDTYFHGWRL